MENHFNLIDEPWIPITGTGLCSLREVFTETTLRGIGGNPVQKIALTKLLLAIAQAATTPENDEDWQQLQPTGMAQACCQYLDRFYDRFYLYGERPFLQIPAIDRATVQSFGAVLPQISTGNTTVLTQSQVERKFSDAARALLIIQLMGFGLGGKKTDNSIVLTPGYLDKFNEKGKPSTGKPGPAIGFLGFLHNFLQGNNLQQTLWLNLITRQDLASTSMFPQGLGVAPWETMPVGEDCPQAQLLKASLMGRLLPLARFCLLTDQGLHYSEGIFYPGYKAGVVDPSVSVNYAGHEAKAIWADTEKRPWRMLPAMLNFLSQTGQDSFDCLQLRWTIKRCLPHLSILGIWSGGLRVSSNAGEQYVSGSDDFVESLLELDCSLLDRTWFENLQTEMLQLDWLSKIIYSATFNYFKSQNLESRDRAAQASNLFWQSCEPQFRKLVRACSDSDTVKSTMRPIFAGLVSRSYDFSCSKNTTRQLDAWAKNRPSLVGYLRHDDWES